MRQEPSVKRGRLLALVVVALTFRAASPAEAGIDYTIAFIDPGGSEAAYYPAIQSNLLAAGADWASHLEGSGTLSILVDITTDFPGVTGRSLTSSFVGTENGISIFEQGAEAKIRTGVSPPGTPPDIEININPNYLATQLWFDPAPTLRTAPVPTDRLDAVSVFTHELAHAFAFNGFRNSQDGQLPAPGNFESTFDVWETFDGTNLFFTGPRAEALYGGPVPITYGDNFHLGNLPPRPGSNLIPDLMNGVEYFYGTRYDLSPLDLAIAADTGVLTTGFPVVIDLIPEPASIILLGLGFIGLLVYIMVRRGIAWRTSHGADGITPIERLTTTTNDLGTG